MDKSKAMGFEVPKGTWMVSMKINNEDTWKQIKNKETSTQVLYLHTKKQGKLNNIFEV